MSQLKKGALFSYFTIFLTVISGLFLTPFIIKSLGDSEYGLYSLIGSFVAYISIMDFGLNNTVVRFVAKYRAEKDQKAEQNFLAITFIIYAFISLAICGIGWVVYQNFDSIFSNSLTEEEISKGKTMFTLLIFNLAVTLPGGAFTGICSAYEHFVFPRVLNIVRHLFRIILIVVLLVRGGDSITLVLIDTSLNIIVVICSMYYVFSNLKVKIISHQIHAKYFKEIFSYSIWVFLLFAISQLQWQSGQFVLGILKNTEAVAIFSIGIMLGTYYGYFATSISSVLLPKATRMVVNKTSEKDITLMMIKIGRLSLIVLLLALGGFILFGKQFIILWMGDHYTPSWYVALIIMICYTLPLTQAFANLILEAKSLFRFKAYVYLIFLSLGVMSGIFLTRKYDIVGMALGIGFGWTLGQIVMNIYFRNRLKIDVLYFFKKTFPIPIIVFVTSIALNHLFVNFGEPNWLSLMIRIMIFSSVYSILTYLFSLNKSEKQIIKNLLC